MHFTARTRFPVFVTKIASGWGLARMAAARVWDLSCLVQRVDKKMNEEILGGLKRTDLWLGGEKQVAVTRRISDLGKSVNFERQGGP